MPTKTPRSNGTAATQLRMPRISTRVDLPAPYTGFYVEMWANPPLRVFSEIQNIENFETLQQRIRELVIDWNLVDYEGKPIAPSDFSEVSAHLIGILIPAYIAQVTGQAEVPKA
jgi:hypothetical protein